jgi:hypothetical protein
MFAIQLSIWRQPALFYRDFDVLGSKPKSNFSGERKLKEHEKNSD